MPKSIEALIKLIEPLLRRVRNAIKGLFKRRPGRIHISTVFFVAAVITGAFYVYRTKQYQEIISTTVRAEGEDTPQRFKVLEAFIMSTVNTNFSDAIKKATISGEFSSGLHAMHEKLSRPTPEAELAAYGDPPNNERNVKISIPDYIRNHEKLPLQNAILTDNARMGFLFFPLSLLRTRLDNNYRQIFDESLTESRSKFLAGSVEKDPVIAEDIVISRKLLPTMQSFTLATLFNENDDLKKLKATMQPVQVYYITKNGVNRIVNNAAAKEQALVYRNMFRATTFFPSRPYYVEAFKRAPTTLANVTGVVKDSFYVSQPYLDIGGFGVVITLALPVRYQSHSDAAICFDISLERDISSNLKNRLKEFGSKPQVITYEIGSHGRIKGDALTGDNEDSGFKNELEDRLRESMKNGDLSKVVGNINILDDQPKHEDVSQASILAFLKYPLEIIFGYNAHPITFALPLDSPQSNSSADGLKVDILISSLNLDRFQQITSLLGLVSVSLLTLAFSIALLSLQGEARILQSYEEAFKTVDGVLYGAPTPYCRLNALDIFVDCNTAFCSMLKMQADRNSVQALIGRTFESLVAPRSRNTYNDVQQRRRAGQEVAPYTLYFTCVDGSEVETRVTSGVIPSRTHRELPGTFGIMVSTSD